MCLSAIVQCLYNILWGPPTAEPHEDTRQDSQYPPEDTLENDDLAPLDQRVLGNSHPYGLRFRANAERAQMIELYQQSHQAKFQGVKAAAKKRAKEHQREMERLDKKASEQIFNENNKRNRPGLRDLHGLHVEEAVSFADRAIEEARERGDTEIRLIVGQGRHSEGGMPKLKPAIEKHLGQRQLIVKPDPKNAGILVVQVDKKQPGEPPLINPRR